MATFTFQPNPSAQFVNWSDPTVWNPQAVPDSTDADVIFPTVTTTANGSSYTSIISISAGQSYHANSVSIKDNYLEIYGSLTIGGALNIQQGGEVELHAGSLTVGSLINNGYDIQGQGSILSNNYLSNQGNIFGSGITFTSPSFTNSGELFGDLTLNTQPGGFTNLKGTTLTGGTYTSAPSGFNYTLRLNVGSVVVTDAATIDVGGGTFESFDPATATYLPLQTTLRNIAAGGFLKVGQYATSTLTVDGELQVAAGATPSFSANQLTIDPNGLVDGFGTIAAAITDNGVLKAISGTSLKVAGNVSGAGTLFIDAATSSVGTNAFAVRAYNPTVMEVSANVSANVLFADGHGRLIVDQPAGLTGVIKAQLGDIIDLSGIDAASVTSTAYSGDANGGVLTINEGNTSQSLRFAGSFDAGSFKLTAGPKPLSSSPPSLEITVTDGRQSGNAFYVDGSQGVQLLSGTSTPSFINTSLAFGSGTVLVDLKNGVVSRSGQVDARLNNIQGVQLGSDNSVVLGLASGTDLIYGGSGNGAFYNEGATDYIQGGTARNAIVGGSGTTIFYGNGGNDSFSGGTGGNFMQAGSTTGSVDAFYGNGGQDFVYAGAGTTVVSGGGGSEYLQGGSGYAELDGSTGAKGFDIFQGGTGASVFRGGAGTNLFNEGGGASFFQGSSGTDLIYGGSGPSFVTGGSGIDVVSTGAGNQHFQAGSGQSVFNDTPTYVTAGRFDQIDNFTGGAAADIYMGRGDQGFTSFVAQNGGTAVLTQVAGGQAEIFVSNTTTDVVQAHTHFTL